MPDFPVLCRSRVVLREAHQSTVRGSGNTSSGEYLSSVARSSGSFGSAAWPGSATARRLGQLAVSGAGCLGTGLTWFQVTAAPGKLAGLQVA